MLFGLFPSWAAQMPAERTRVSPSRNGAKRTRGVAGKREVFTAGLIILVKGEDDRDLHVCRHALAGFAAGLELPLTDGLNGGGLEFVLRRLERIRVLHVARGIDDEVDNHFAGDARAAHFKWILGTSLVLRHRLLIEHGGV